jgi:transcriptional regulator with XRE-family HTH domain
MCFTLLSISNIGKFLGIVERIKKVRGELTQAEFAAKLGVQAATVSMYESGRIPDDEMLIKIADFGKTTMEWLLRGDQLSAPQLLEQFPEVLIMNYMAWQRSINFWVMPPNA